PPSPPRRRGATVGSFGDRAPTGSASDSAATARLPRRTRSALASMRASSLANYVYPRVTPTDIRAWRRANEPPAAADARRKVIPLGASARGRGLGSDGHAAHPNPRAKPTTGIRGRPKPPAARVRQTTNDRGDETYLRPDATRSPVRSIRDLRPVDRLHANCVRTDGQDRSRLELPRDCIPPLDARYDDGDLLVDPLFLRRGATFIGRHRKLSLYVAALLAFALAIAASFHAVVAHPGSEIPNGFSDATNTIRNYWAASVQGRSPFTLKRDAL